MYLSGRYMKGWCREWAVAPRPEGLVPEISVHRCVFLNGVIHNGGVEGGWYSLTCVIGSIRDLLVFRSGISVA
jgi:hypothetical protein